MRNDCRAREPHRHLGERCDPRRDRLGLRMLRHAKRTARLSPTALKLESAAGTAPLRVDKPRDRPQKIEPGVSAKFERSRSYLGEWEVDRSAGRRQGDDVSALALRHDESAAIEGFADSTKARVEAAPATQKIRDEKTV